MKPLLGQGLVTNDGESWLQQRRLRQPAFHRKRLAAFGTLMTDATVSMFDQWQRFAERNQPLAVAAEMLRLTLLPFGSDEVQGVRFAQGRRRGAGQYG